MSIAPTTFPTSLLSLPDALPIYATTTYGRCPNGSGAFAATAASTKGATNMCSSDVSFAVWPGAATVQTVIGGAHVGGPDRKSTRMNYSHLGISYDVFCLAHNSHN